MIEILGQFCVRRAPNNVGCHFGNRLFGQGALDQTARMLFDGAILWYDLIDTVFGELLLDEIDQLP